MAMTPRELLARLRDRFRRDQLAAELDDELRFHQAMLERDHRALGADTTEARRRGRLQLGNPTYLREETRAMWSLGWVDDVLQDARYAARTLRHNLAFTTAVVLTLALGIGANTAIFSVVNAVVLRPLPYADPDRLHSVWTVPVDSPLDRNPVSYPDLRDWQTQNTVFTGIGGYAFNRFELSSTGGSDFVRAVLGTPNLYEVLGATPLVGRMPRADEEHARVVAISHRLWKRRFGGDRGVLGTTVTMDEQPYTVVGVMPPGFHFPTPDVDLWTTMATIHARGSGPDNGWLSGRGLRGYRTVARLKPSVTPAAAEAQMNAIADRLGEAYPDLTGGTDIRLQSVRDDTVRSVRRALWLVLGAAGLVLLLACANVAHLMLARVSSRAREIAIRRAMGADRGRVTRQLLTESLMLGALGGIVGLAVAAGGMRVLVALSPGDIPRLENVALDTTTLLFAAAVSLLTGILFGLAPTIVAWKGAVYSVLREQGRGTVGGHGTRMRSILTTLEVAFALVVLVGAGLMVRSFATLLDKDLGFRSEDRVVFQVGFSRTRYPTPNDQAMGLDRLLTAVRAIPGVTSAGASTSMPPVRIQQGNGFTIEGEPAPEPGREPSAILIPASPGFLPTLGVRLVAGRQLTDGDNAVTAPRVALVSRDLARRHFAGREPVGRQLRMLDTVWTIVGVVDDVTYEGLSKPIRPALYLPWAQNPFAGAWVVAKTAGDPGAVLAALNGAVRGVDPLMTPREPRTVDDFVSEAMVRPRFQTWLLTTFGGLALVLAAVGIYGVIAYGVAQRTSEIGLRLALGAPPRSVVRLLLRRGMTPVVVGLGVGVAGALGLTRLMAGILFDVSPTDTLTFVAMTTLLAGVAAAAAYVPSRRATRLDPVAALRAD